MTSLSQSLYLRVHERLRIYHIDHSIGIVYQSIRLSNLVIQSCLLGLLQFLTLPHPPLPSEVDLLALKRAQCICTKHIYIYHYHYHYQIIIRITTHGVALGHSFQLASCTDAITM